MKAIRSIIAGVLLIPALALAEPVKVDKPVECYKMERGLKHLIGEFGEQPIWLGSTAEGHQSGLFLNPKTGTWTFVTAPNGDTLCIIEHGTGFQMKAMSHKPGQDI